MNDLASSVFKLNPDVYFLNHGSFGATPRRVVEARRRWEDHIEAQPVAYLWDQVQTDLEPICDSVGAFVGAEPGSLTFVENATTGVNAILCGMDWEPGDVVVLLTHAYGAVVNTVKELAERYGIELRFADVPFPIASEDDVIEALTPLLDGAKVAVLDHITSPTGLVLPLKPMVDACTQAGVLSVIDGAHAPGQVPLHLADLGCDYYVGNLHKWAFAARGTALLYRNPKAPIPRALVTSHGFAGTLHDRFLWPGTRDFTAWLSVPEALQTHTDLGGADLMNRNRALAAECGEWLAHRWGVKLPSPPSMRAALCALPAPFLQLSPTDDPGQTTRAWSRRMWHEHHVEVPVIPFAGQVWIRFSIQAYNEASDVERLAEATTACFGAP